MSLISLERESEETSFDWFKSYKDIADIIRELIPEKSSRILMLGCGNSTLSQDVSVQDEHPQCPDSDIVLHHQMYEDGYRNIVNTDVRVHHG